MELELKHLAAYLPYGLKMYYDDGGEFYLNELTGVDTDCCRIDGDVQYLPMDFKPALRPMSDVEDDLFDEIGFADEEDFIQSVLDGDIFQKNFNKLLSLRFDVFGLIPAGLAVDINTIQS